MASGLVLFFLSRRAAGGGMIFSALSKDDQDDMRRGWGTLGRAASFVLPAGALAETPSAASADDTARISPVCAPSPGSSLEPLTHDASWQSHAKYFDKAWAGLDQRQLSKIKAWSAKNVADPQAGAVLHVQRSGLPVCGRLLRGRANVRAFRARAGWAGAGSGRAAAARARVRTAGTCRTRSTRCSRSASSSPKR